MTINPDKHISKICDAGHPVTDVNLLLDAFDFFCKEILVYKALRKKVRN